MNLREEKEIVSLFAPILGLSKFKISVKKADLQDEEIARANCDFSALTIEILKGKEYYKLSKDAQKNVLIHELVESRLLLMEQRIEDRTASIIYEEREEVVNEIADAFMRLR